MLPSDSDTRPAALAAMHPDVDDLTDAADVASGQRDTDTTRAGEQCARCGAPDGEMTLLTSMTRYFFCAACRYSWQVTRSGT